MSVIKVQGDSIHYITGDSFDESLPTVLLVHGAGQNSSTWDYQLDLLRNFPKANFIVIDLPGHGKSEGEGRRTVKDYSDFLKQFTDAAGLRNIIITGHSMGGGVVMHYALEHPEDIAACILVGTGANISVAGQSLEAVKNNYELFCEVAPTRAFAQSSPERLRDSFKKCLLDIDRGVCYWDLVAFDRFDIRDRVSGIKAPTMIITGSEDLLTLPKHGLHLHEQIKDSVYHEIEDAGHFMMQEKPQLFNRLFLEFLDARIERS